MNSQIIKIDIHNWSITEPRSRWITELENGKVLYFPYLKFQLLSEEKILLTSTVHNTRVRNISLNNFNYLHGTCNNIKVRSALTFMMDRFRQQVKSLIYSLAPKYQNALRLASTSYRPALVETRKQSWRANDRKLHIDAFPTRPNYGERILRVFCNINPYAVPRIWKIGESFQNVAEKFLPCAKRYIRWQAKILQMLHVTKSLRSEYDHLMLQLHNNMKADEMYQKYVQQIIMQFSANSVWICFSDQVSHAVMSGQFMLEQTLHLPVEKQYNPTFSPLAILTKLIGHSLI